jgi:hypothetical protein
MARSDYGQQHLKHVMGEAQADASPSTPTTAQRVKGMNALKGQMKANYESPGLRGQSTMQRDDATSIADKFGK